MADENPKASTPADPPKDFKTIVKGFPTTPGVYLMKNVGGKVIYVGKAKSLRARVRTYFNSLEDQSLKTKHLVAQIRDIEYVLTKTEVEAFLLEASLIKKLRPRYNIRLKDDKSYPYIRCSIGQPYPRFYLARKVQNDGGIYFGPYTSGLAVRETMRFLNRTFKIRDCTDGFFRARTRPCITYQMGHCTAPCVNLVSEKDYQRDVKSALDFLKGRKSKLIKEMTRQMKDAAAAERFEVAAKLRDSLHAVETILEKQTVVSMNVDFDQDVAVFVGDERGAVVETLHVRAGRVIGSRPHFLSKFNPQSPDEDIRDWFTSFLNQYYLDNVVPDEILLSVDLGLDIVKLLQNVFRERAGKVPKISVATGEDGYRLVEMAMQNAKSHFQDMVAKRDFQMEGLQQIQAKFGLKELPRRIECYDISHFQGTENVASQVVFEDGVPKKDDYRRYRLKSFEGANDFAAMKEVLSRRFTHTEYDDPGLLVVDGGKGQLSMAVEVLKEIGRMDIPVVGLAKARVKGEFQDAEVKATEERFFLPGRQNPVTFATNSGAFQILVGIRDEAHRFAITYHRKLRGDRTLASTLDEIPGLGPAKKKTLLKTFESIGALKQAGADAISAVKGIDRVLAERIVLHLEDAADESEE